MISIDTVSTRRWFNGSVSLLVLARALSHGKAGNALLAAAGCGLLGGATLLARPAAAQSASPQFVTGAQTLTGATNGEGGAGYWVQSGGTLNVSNGALQNFVTTGGAGSGGGAGFGGAIFVDNGGTVVLNNVSVSGNSAVGGLGGAGTVGGTLDNIQSGNVGTTGAAGTQFQDNATLFGNGAGGGVNGTNGGAGGTGNGTGGTGGQGGAGSNGWATNPNAEGNLAAANQALSTANLAEDSAILNVVTASAQEVIDVAAAAGYLSDPNPLSKSTDIIAFIAASATALNQIVGIASAATGLASAIPAADAAQAAQQGAQQALSDWQSALGDGSVGNGGNGGDGGTGGAGASGFGGGQGGAGGQYGVATGGAAIDGQGGSGGAGGAGGFGGGGGQGGQGYAAGAGLDGVGLNSGTDNGGSASGAGGAGGAGGFGAGVGSTGGVGTGASTGGGGGDGYGGAIFVNTGGRLVIEGDTTFANNNAVGGASANGGLAGNGVGTDLFMMAGATVVIAPGAGNTVTFDGAIADNSISSIGSANGVSQGASLKIYAGTTVFNGANTYSGQTIIDGGAYGGSLNTGANTAGAPNYALTDAALQAVDGVGLPTQSNLNFAGPNQWTGGVFQTSGLFSRWVGALSNDVQWTGSGGFAAYGATLNVALDQVSPGVGGPLQWGLNGFVPFGSSLIFGSATSNAVVNFTNAIDITGGSLASGNAASILVGANGNAAGSTAIMSGVISGVGDLSVNGGGFNGNLYLSAANTYIGATQVNSGTLALIGAGSIAYSSQVNVASGATFDISQTSAGASIVTLSDVSGLGGGLISLGAKTLTITDGATSFSGSIVDGGLGGGLTIAGGVQVLSGTNTYTGLTTIKDGATLALSGPGSIMDSSGVSVVSGGTFDISPTSYGAVITTLSGDSTGQVALGGSNQALYITAGSTSFAGVIADGGLNGGTGGNLSIMGGTQTLTGDNTYTGVTFIASGAGLALSGTGSIATSSAVVANGVFDISRTTGGATINTLAGSGQVALGGAAQTLTIANGSTIFAGVIADGGIGGGIGGNVELAGGAQMLTGANTYTGATTIDAGATLVLAGTGSIATSSGVAANGLFDISQTTSGAAITTLSGAGVVGLGAQTLTISAGSTTFAGGIYDGGIQQGAFGGNLGGAVTIAGGTQTFTGANQYTGATTIASGATLALSGTGSIATSSSIDANGVFDISQTTSGATINTLAGSGQVALGGAAQTLTIANGSTIFAGVIADGGTGGGTGGNLAVAGGTQTLAGTANYTGATTIDKDAALALAGTGSIATSSSVTANGLFDISQTTSGATIATLSGAGAVGLGAQTLTISDGSTTFAGGIYDGGILQGAFGGSLGGAVTIAGGAQTLAGVNYYTGATTIASGATLALSGAGSIATSSGVMNAGLFDISQTTSGAAIATLGGAGSVALGSETLTITDGAAGTAGTDPAGVFSGVIGGQGGVAITGGHQELTGVNTYSGGTSVANAILSVNSGASLGAATGALTLNNAILVADANISTSRPVTLVNQDEIQTNSYVVSLGGNIGGSGELFAAGGGTLNLTGANTYSGGTVVLANTTLTTNSGAALGSGQIIVDEANGKSVDLFTGSVHVVGALDLVNGATTELIILPGDSLVGVGTVNVPVLVEGSGGNTPGDGPGTIVATSSVVQSAGSTFSVDIDGAKSSVNCASATGCAGAYSSTVVVGAGNTFTAGGVIAPVLRGIAAPANNDYTPPVTTSFVVVQAQGGVLGSFSSITQPSAGLAPSTRLDALYTSNDITLYVTPQNYQNLSAWNTSLTQNQSQVGMAINALRGAAGPRNTAAATSDLGALYQVQPQALPATFDTLSGEAVADARFVAANMTSQFLELMLDPSTNGHNTASAGVDQHWTTWATPFGSGFNAAGEATVGSHDVNGWAGGLAAGADYRFDASSMAGFAFSGGGSTWDLSQGLGGGHTDAFQAGVYGSTHFGALYVAGSASLSDHAITTTRSAFTGETLDGSFNAQSYGARLETGYRYALNERLGLSPYVAVEAQSFQTPGFSETNQGVGNFALAYNSSSEIDVRSEIGARIDSQTDLGNGMSLSLNARAAYLYDAVSNPAMMATFVAAQQPGAMPGAATSFAVNGAPLPHSSVFGLLAADLQVTPLVALGVKATYADAFSRDAQSYGGAGSVRVTW